MSIDTGTGINLGTVNEFVQQECRLADANAYEKWADLWAQNGDSLYWVPGQYDDRFTKASFICDNKARLKTRVKQLLTGHRFSQVPPSRLARVTSDLEIIDDDPTMLDLTGIEHVTARCSFVLVEYRNETTLWAGHLTYQIGREGDRLVLFAKKVDLVNRAAFLTTLTFII
jgi:3-phenylpropionate/cinnamic acid dioxygenase small subunit